MSELRKCIDGLAAAEAAQGYVAENHEVVLEKYNEAGVEDVLRRFAFSEPPPHPLDENSILTTESHVTVALYRYSCLIGPLAMDPSGSLKIPFVREAYDTVVAGMNKVGNERLGFARPATLLGRFLVNAELKKPEARQFFSPLPDHFWNIQSPKEYADQTRAKRREGESERNYTAAYIFHILRNFAFAPFSHIQQAEADGFVRSRR